MKKILTIITVFSTLFLITVTGLFHNEPGHAQGTKPTPLILPGADFSAMHNAGTSIVSEVINPMTIKLEDGRTITLSGLDYPDLDFYNPGELAITAQKVLEDFLKGKHVTIYQTPQADQGRINRMGHHIAHLSRHERNTLKGNADNSNVKNKDTWVQGLILSLGLARVRTTKYNREMAAQLLQLEQQARTDKSGLWAMEKYAPLTPEQAKNHIGRYQIIEGQVQNIGMHKNKIYINFGNNWRDDFTLGISGTNARTFRRENINPLNWNNARLRVRGWIESYNGPYIEIDHPERIEILSPIKKEKDTPTPSKTDKSFTKDGSSLPAYNK
ncbi:MAG: thermonuclease family protein [Alphaproteobacteria bacterium]